MRIPVECLDCLFGDPPKKSVAYLSPTDSGRYVRNCEAGHNTVTVLQQQRFEVLFELAANAIVDGYYREAIQSFTASLERFYEFAIRCLAIATGVGPEALKGSWKSVARQSERQIGAYVFVWALCFKEEPPLLPNKEIELRNKVTHAGTLPTRDEALNFGETVLRLIRPQMYKLMSAAKDALDIEVTTSLYQRATGKPGDVSSQSNLSIPTLIALVTIDERQKTMSLTDYLPTLERWRNSARDASSASPPP